MKRLFTALLLVLIGALSISGIGPISGIQPVRADGDPSLLDIFTQPQYMNYTNIVESNLQTFIPGTYNVTLYAEFADYYNQNELSWYKKGTSEYGVIFYGPEGTYGNTTPRLTESFTVDTEFGLSLISPLGRYFTETARNGDGLEHAVVYESFDEADPDIFDKRNPGTYLIGWEDDGDFDYNDMVISLELFRPKTVEVSGLDWYHMTYTQDRIVIAMLGASPGQTSVTFFPLYSGQEYRDHKIRFFLNLLTNGFDILVINGRPEYSGTQSWVKDAADWSRNHGYDDVYLFGFSGGAVVTAYEIQKEYATMEYTAAILTCGPVNWAQHSGVIFHSALTANDDRVSTCFIEPINDMYDFYDQMQLYYNNTLTDRIWYDWWNGHDPFSNTAIDYPGLTLSQACINWFNASHPPNTPKVWGPTIAYKNYQATYFASTIDPNHNNIIYQFDWGDGSFNITGFVPSGSTVSMDHTWTSTGTYDVTVFAVDNQWLPSCQSPPFQVTVNILYVTLTLSIPQAPPPGTNLDGTPREPVSIWVDGSEYEFFALTTAYISVEAGVQHNLTAQTPFFKEEWKPGYYYIYTFQRWSDGVTSRTRTINTDSDLTLVAYYTRSRYGWI